MKNLFLVPKVYIFMTYRVLSSSREKNEKTITFINTKPTLTFNTIISLIELNQNNQRLICPIKCKIRFSFQLSDPFNSTSKTIVLIYLINIYIYTDMYFIIYITLGKIQILVGQSQFKNQDYLSSLKSFVSQKVHPYKQSLLLNRIHD